MTAAAIRSAFGVLVVLVAGIVLPSVPGQPPASAEPRPKSVAGMGLVPPGGAVAFDEPGDGSLWAVGRTYKIEFAAGAATWHPRFSPRAPANFPITFTVESAAAGGTPLAFVLDSRPARDGDRVSFDRGAFVESWTLAPDAAEQTFRFDRLPAAGDVVLRVNAATALFAGEDAGGIRFTGAHGAVAYSAAIAVDAGGRRAAAATRLAGGAIEIRVDAGFAAAADLPLVIDPVVTTLPVATGTDETFAPDVAFNGNTGRFLAVWEVPFSASDHDVYAQLIDFNGVLVAGSGAWVDATSSYWSLPRVANLSSLPRYLVVAQVGAPGTIRSIWGRARDAVTSSLGPQFPVSGAEPGDKVFPDVGGDRREARVHDAGLHRERGQRHRAVPRELRAPDVVLPAGVALPDRRPALRRDRRAAVGVRDRGEAVVLRTVGERDVAWPEQRRAGGDQPRVDVMVAGREHPLPDDAPVRGRGVERVSTVTDAATGHRRYLVAFEAAAGPGLHDTGFLILEGSAIVTGTLSLSALEGALLDDRSLPVADSDGCTFTIAYAERYLGNPADYDILATTLAVGGAATAVVSEGRELLATTALLEDHAAIASSFSGGGPGLRHLVLWDVAAATFDIRGAAYDAHAPGSGLAILPTGCQGLNLAVSGVPAIGQTMTFTLTNAGSPSLLAFGIPIPPLTFCGVCQLGLDTFTAYYVYVPSVTVRITCDGFLIGLQVAVQGADLGGSFCNGLRVSNTAVITIL